MSLTIVGENDKLGLPDVRFDSGQARPLEGTKKDDTVVKLRWQSMTLSSNIAMVSNTDKLL